MNQNVAKRLFQEGGIFLFLDVPEGTEFGIDMKSWNTGEKFRGVKMIPPGIHYIFYSAVSNTGDIAPRTGFFYNFKLSEMVGRKWDKETNDISKDVVAENQLVGFKDNILALDQFLGPYPYDIADKWFNLTSHITENLIERIQPIAGIVRSALELVSCDDAERPKGHRIDEGSPSTSKNPRRLRLSDADELLDTLLPNLKPVPGTELRFTSLPDISYPEGSTPAEITRHNMDLSYTLECFIKEYNSDLDVIGELELAYICFLAGHSLEAFEHWKNIIGLLCSCEKAINQHRNLYDAFMTLLEIQIIEIPEEFLADIVSNSNFVYIKLRDLFRFINDSKVDGRLKTKAERFMKTLTDTFGWDFKHLELDDEDDAPVIVET